MFGFGKKNYFDPGPDGAAPVIAFVSKTLTVPVYEVPAMVGRSPDQADAAINDATVSRRHFYISTYDNKFTVTDQGSTSGTVINGELLEPGVPYYLSEGDKIKIGKLDFVCHINKARTGKKLKLPSFIENDRAGDTSEMSKADIAAAAAQSNAVDAGSAEELVNDPASEAAREAEAAAEVMKAAEAAMNAEQNGGPVINLMPDPVLEEADDEKPGSEGLDDGEPEERTESKAEDPVAELEEMGLEFDDGPEKEAENTPDKVEEPAGSSVDIQEGADAPDGAAPATIDVMRGNTTRTGGKVNGPKFVYYSGNTAVESFTVSATPFVIGRAESDYTPGAAGVSRRHCFIDRTGTTYFITDLESTNGVWINGRKIKPYNRTALVSGDIVGIGDRVYRYEQN